MPSQPLYKGVPKRSIAMKESQKRYYEKNKAMVIAKERDTRYKKDFGITVADYNSLLANQLYKCAICQSDVPGNKDHNFTVDHCHKTGKVRGLLCRRCNLLLGKALDDAAILHTAEVYLLQGGFKK